MFFHGCNYYFQLFDIQHIICLIITFSLLVILVINKNRIYSLSKNKKEVIQFILALVIIVNLLFNTFNYLYHDAFSFKSSLHLYYCHIVAYLYSFSIILEKPKFRKLVFPLLFTGPLSAILLPSITRGYLCYKFYFSIINHNLLFLIGIFGFYCYKEKYKIYDYIHSYTLAIGIMLSTYLYNFIFKTSYNTPNSLLSHLYKLFNYPGLSKYGILIFLGIGLIGIFISYLFIKLSNKKK